MVYSLYVMRLLLNHIEFELLALECGAPPGGRSKTGRKAAGAQRPTPCETEGRASMLAEDQKWGVVQIDGIKNAVCCHKPFIQKS